METPKKMSRLHTLSTSSLSNVRLLAKGRSVTWVINKATVRARLQTVVVSSLPIFFPASSLQTRCDDGPNPDLYDEFNIDTHVENVEDWVGDDQIMELTRGNPSKMAEALALEVKLVLPSFPRTLTQFRSQRPRLGGAGPTSSVAGHPSLTQGILSTSTSTLGVSGFASSQSSSGSSQVSGVRVPPASSPLTQGVFGFSTSAVGIGGSIASMPSASDLSLNSSQASSVNVPSAPTPGLCRFDVFPYIY